MNIRLYQDSDRKGWDEFVINHPNGTLYHLSKWKDVVENAYGHNTYYLIALNEDTKPENNSPNPRSRENFHSRSPHFQQKIVGILPLVHLKHFLFGNKLISMPFFDMGGVLADNREVEQILLTEAVKLAEQLGANSIELRQTYQISYGSSDNSEESPTNKSEVINNSPFTINNYSIGIRSHKVRMLLELPESSEALMKSFKSKLRSQIRKPIKEGLIAKIGGLELLNDFYEAFAINMRDLGSPVHSKNLMKNVLVEFGNNARIIIVYLNNESLACSLVVGFKDLLANPWASALRKYSRLAPNMLLYWTMLEYACDNGYKYFDFGRSTPGEGTYKFKAQWGARPLQLYWHYMLREPQIIDDEESEKTRFEKFIGIWQRLPVPVTKVLGPVIRKNIGL